MIEGVSLYHGDCLDVLKTLPDNSVDSVVTDPPYGINFMNKKWDYDVPSVAIWEEVFRVLKPGGHLLSFSGSRTYHRMAVNIEDAGFEIRDQIMWLYSTGFPKSLDVSKAIDKAAGVDREIINTTISKSEGMAHIMKTNLDQGYRPGDYYVEAGNVIHHTKPATAEAQQWDGWGTALKPAHEPIVVARKPLSEGTVVANVLKWGTGAINIEASRIPLNGDYKCKPNGSPSQTGLGDNYNPLTANQPDDKGRWPANVIHDGSDEVMDEFAKYGESKSTVDINLSADPTSTWFTGGEHKRISRGDSGTPARFFYSAKVSKKERNEGMPEGKTNTHPTVKPITLMSYLINLVTPPNGTILDPFMGSGSTGVAANKNGFGFVGIEKDGESFDIASYRIGCKTDDQVEPDVENEESGDFIF